jgi:hypothetical protein
MDAEAPDLVLIRITQGSHESEYVSATAGFPLPLSGRQWFLSAEVGMAFRFFLPAAHEMVGHLNKHHYAAELLPIEGEVVSLGGGRIQG